MSILYSLLDTLFCLSLVWALVSLLFCFRTWKKLGLSGEGKAAPLLRSGSERPGRVARLAVGLAFHVWNSGNDAVHDRDTGCLVDKRKVKQSG